MSTAPVIQVEHLVKTFGAVRALDGLELEVTPGEVHGFLGPNGSGKSTTIRILLGLVRATEGRAELLGGDPWHDAAALHARVAYVPGDVALWPGLTGGQCLDLLASASGAVSERRRAALVEMFDLDPTKRIRDYSKGNRQKVALVAAFAAEVDLLVLDEPSSGLDPLMEQVFQQCVRDRREAGATVLLSSHILGEVEALADRVTIIRRGRTVSSGSLADLRKHTRTQVHALTAQAPQGLSTSAGVADLSVEGASGRVESRFSVDADHLDDVVGHLHRARIATLTITPPSLDDLFLRTYGDPREGDAPPTRVEARR
jgi:polyether ionophore transport system ATP-binding protein